jgi:hypothetical protein
MFTHTVSGLQWINNYTSQLCTRSLIFQSPLNSLLSLCTSVLFLVGTSSIRTIPAIEIIDQIEEAINIVRSHHTDLHNKYDISLTATFPCYKTSTHFPSILSLTNNLKTYNELLQISSQRLNFCYFDLNITDDYLNSDYMHIHPQHQPFIFTSIINYFNDLMNKKQSSSHTKSRSHEATTRRNRQ